MKMQLRTGIGYDVHQLKDNAPFWLGGINIEHTKGAVGHSDADVLIHAICDALLGAANLGDIGTHFSDQDAKYKGIDSKILLADVCKLMESNNYSIVNIDSSIVLEKPKISSFISMMKKVLAETMNITQDQLSIKATTSEHMGFVGREEGISAFATTLIIKN